METSSATGALKAYTEAVKRAQGMDVAKDGLEKTGDSGGSFSDMMKGVIDKAVQQGNDSEQASIKALAGTGDPLDVVTAITSAEVTLQTVVSVRDKMVEAYHEIMRMPI